MAQRLPSLNALRAFEAAARHMSLTKAAEELHVTPAAISHQIKALEADIGAVLMRRVKGEYLLTEPAKAALAPLRAGFEQLAEAARRMRSEQGRHFLTLSVGPTFAASWLVRRLGRFKAAYSEIDVRLDTTDRLTDFVRDGVDIAIRFGHGDYPGLESLQLFAEEIYPVCSPALLAQGPLRSPSDLAGHTLIHVDWTRENEETYDWKMWLTAAGASGVDYERGPRFSHSNLALQTAIDGQGLALGSDSLAGDDLQAGRLVRPFDVALPMHFAYFLVYPLGSAEVPKIAAFRDWVLEEARATQSATRSATL